MLSSDKIIRDCLVSIGAERPPEAGGEALQKRLDQREEQRLRERLRAIAARNAPLAWLLMVGVFTLAVAGFVATAFIGGTLGLASGGFATLFILPIGGFLHQVLKDKFRTEVLLELLPTLTPEGKIEALKRFLYRDDSE